ncbi:hypothetical protein CH373_05215 [Leptospira perolatii]|uniref:Uncharacterized protein n=1 Tax=Leptospira perolatii TaxID=2023191 RepID=A0A2M9ZQS0_9LEPT|nr:hypothetical protein CH360_05635 [Leptospira perolatii]PJZ74309.1 hypothetical protein CH373_05215 [Leptospira perolatii]
MINGCLSKEESILCYYTNPLTKELSILFYYDSYPKIIFPRLVIIEIELIADYSNNDQITLLFWF